MESTHVIETVDAAVKRYNKAAEEYDKADNALWELSEKTLPKDGYTFYYEKGSDLKIESYVVGTAPQTLVEVEFEPEPADEK